MEARYQTAPSPDQYSWEGCDLPDPRDALPNCAKPRPVFLGRVRPSRSSGRATKLRQAPAAIEFALYLPPFTAMKQAEACHIARKSAVALECEAYKCGSGAAALKSSSTWNPFESAFQ